MTAAVARIAAKVLCEVEIVCPDTRNEGIPFLTGENQDRATSRAILALAYANITARQFGYFQAVAVCGTP
jgi:hypothetical protein